MAGFPTGARWALPAMVCACLAGPALSGDRSMKTHMGIQAEPRLEAGLEKLPSLKIDVIQASVPVNDRMNSDEAFDRPFTESLKEAMAWYLTQRGLRVVEQGEDLRLVGTIDSYEGWKGWGRWGVDVTLRVKLFRGPEIVLTDALRSFLKYSDDEDVQNEEKPRYKAHDMRVSFPEILFTRVGVDLCEKLIVLLKEKLPAGGLPPPSASKAVAPERGTVSVDASAPNAEVLIDGSLVGMTPIKDLALPAGDHTMEVRKAGFMPWKRDFQVVPGAATRFFAELVPPERD